MLSAGRNFKPGKSPARWFWFDIVADMDHPALPGSHFMADRMKTCLRVHSTKSPT